MLDLIKSNPLKSLATVVGFCSTLIGAFIAVDSRYAHADEVNKQQTEVRELLNTMRKSQIEDKLFELDLRKSQTRNNTLSPIDQALRDRYARQLQDLQQQQQR